MDESDRDCHPDGTQTASKGSFHSTPTDWRSMEIQAQGKQYSDFQTNSEVGILCKISMKTKNYWSDFSYELVV